MKAFFTLLTLAVPAFAGLGADVFGGKGNEPDYQTTSVTVFTTVTTCPLVRTTTEKGTTYEVTELTTSTITVTSCLGGHCGRGAGNTVTVPGPTSVIGTTTEVVISYTTTCPITETVTAPGKTYLTTYTTTKPTFTKVLTTIYNTVTEPPVTKATEVFQYNTLTSLVPVTETKTVQGSAVVVTWTSTKEIVTHIPTTQVVYTTLLTTSYKTTDVYVTQSCKTTVQTTVVQGSTEEVTVTNTKYITSTSSYVTTTVIPVTQTRTAELTKVITLSSGATITQYPTTIITKDGTVYTTSTPKPTTIAHPTTLTSSAPINYGSDTMALGYTSSYAQAVSSSSTSSQAPVQITNAASSRNAPAMAVLVGVLGVLVI